MYKHKICYRRPVFTFVILSETFDDDSSMVLILPCKKSVLIIEWGLVVYNKVGFETCQLFYQMIIRFVWKQRHKWMNHQNDLTKAFHGRKKKQCESANPWQRFERNLSVCLNSPKWPTNQPTNQFGIFCRLYFSLSIQAKCITLHKSSFSMLTTNLSLLPNYFA